MLVSMEKSIKLTIMFISSVFIDLLWKALNRRVSALFIRFLLGYAAHYEAYIK